MYFHEDECNIEKAPILYFNSKKLRIYNCQFKLVKLKCLDAIIFQIKKFMKKK